MLENIYFQYHALVPTKGLYGKSIKGADYLSGSRKINSKKKQNVRFAITYITKQDFRKFNQKFYNSTYLGCKSKQVNNEQTQAYFLPIKHITKLIKYKRHVQIRTKGVKLGVNKKIGHVATQSEELEGINVTTTCTNKYNQTSSAYDIKDEEKNSSTSENK